MLADTLGDVIVALDLSPQQENTLVREMMDMCHLANTNFKPSRFRTRIDNQIKAIQASMA